MEYKKLYEPLRKLFQYWDSICEKLSDRFNAYNDVVDDYELDFNDDVYDKTFNHMNEK